MGRGFGCMMGGRVAAGGFGESEHSGVFSVTVFGLKEKGRREI